MASDRILNELVLCVPVAAKGHGLQATDIYRLYDKWAPVTVRVALGELAEEGRITYEIGANRARLYRREP